MTRRPDKKTAAEVYLSKWPEGSLTRSTYVSALSALAQACGGGDAGEAASHYQRAVGFAWHELRYEDVRALPAELVDAGYAVVTINKMLSALRGVLETAWRLGQMPDEEYRRIKVESLRGNRLPAGRAITPQEAEKLRRTLGQVDQQLAALIAFMRATGARRAEVATLTRGCYDAREGVVRVLGKGKKQRDIPVGKEFRPYLERHLDELPDDPRAPVFTSRRGEPITPRGVSYELRLFCEAAGIDVSPHDLRRSYATELLEAGVDIATVQKLMGHESINTTVIYDRRGDAQKRAAAETIK